MIGLNSLVQTMNNLQTDAQANVPVTPNNGNPAGANNMPAAQPTPALQHYPWLAPSVHMANIRNKLAARARPATQQPAAIPPTQHPAQPVVPQALPVLPIRGG